jgi:hypothetical protein
MFRTESKLQCWRALAITDNEEFLLCLGLSSTQVRGVYVEAFEQVLDEEKKDQVQAIALERWNGAADVGRWTKQTNLTVPKLPGKPALSRQR